MPGYQPIGTAKVITLFRGRDQTPRLAAGVRHIERETTNDESRRPLTGTRFGCSANRWRRPTKAVSCLKLLTLAVCIGRLCRSVAASAMPSNLSGQLIDYKQCPAEPASRPMKVHRKPARHFPTNVESAM